MRNLSKLSQEILRQVKGLDRIKCELCGEDKKVFIHHIDRDKDNNNLKNLILLCSNCHHKAHFGQDWELIENEEYRRQYYKKNKKVILKKQQKYNQTDKGKQRQRRYNQKRVTIK